MSVFIWEKCSWWVFCFPLAGPYRAQTGRCLVIISQFLGDATVPWSRTVPAFYPLPAALNIQHAEAFDARWASAERRQIPHEQGSVVINSIKCSGLVRQGRRELVWVKRASKLSQSVWQQPNSSSRHLLDIRLRREERINDFPVLLFHFKREIIVPKSMII